MSNNITVVNTLPEKNWCHFVEEHPAGNIFHTPEMFQVFKQIMNLGCGRPKIVKG